MSAMLVAGTCDRESLPSFYRKSFVEGADMPGQAYSLRRSGAFCGCECKQCWTASLQVNLQSLGNNESYQDRLARLEGHKESLVLQVSVLTDQVEAQGEKIRDLENSLEEHHQKLSSTEEMLQQELRSRTSLESQKLDLMDEVSYLKLKLVGMEEKQSHNTERQHKAESVVNLISELQEQMCRIQLELHSKIREKQAAEMDAEGGPGGHGSGPAQSLACETEEEGLLQELRLLRDKVNELEDEKSQYERKLKATKVSIKGLKKGTVNKSSLPIISTDQELQRLKTGMESLIAANEEKVGTLSSAQPQVSTVCLGILSFWLHRKKAVCVVNVRGTISVIELFFLLVGKTEKTDDTTSSDVSPMSSGADSGQQSPVAQENKNNKSIKKLWGKIRRTQSGGLNGDDLGPTEFRRGGLRATAGPRLARTPDSGSSVCDKNTPFSKWTREQVCGWLEDFGLGQYVNLSRQWIESGQTLLSATPQDFEKEMGIKHPLHRKKLQLAMRTFSTKMMEKYSEVDPIWVTRWLDDIGLPQYKDQFHESRVDGRMLQYLTVNDLLFLKVTSQLHHLSIKCAIHVLHVNKFNPYCLRRRPGDENKTSPSEVVQWSNHRVMEWLRSVDLAEYAPNLRGSGVHGGLIILEPRFNSDTLAMLLNIPPQKTLLRRHLATNFTSLVGPQAQQEKREYATATGHTPLTTTAKVRPKKLGFTHFGHLRKRRPDDSADYICPIDTASLLSVNGGPHRPYGSFRGLSINPDFLFPVTCLVSSNQGL
uniref:SAM domain-containing protein n=1 Tax=Denticeps clupeoides TaxID=299321 RepID=A0AAY4BBH3_9TELE